MRLQKNFLLIILATEIAGATQVFGLVQRPTAETGYYFMYDDESESPFSQPELPPLPDFESIWNKAGAKKCFSFGDRPYPFPLPDSFWYYGHWYVPGDKLYFVPDGWISFDPYIEVDGAPTPPLTVPPFPITDHPNSIMAPLWQDNNCTLTQEPSDSNRQWYYYDAASSIVTFQWFDIRTAALPDNVYDYEVMLHLGGQAKLVTDQDSGVVFSYHFIEFLYNTSNAGWTAEEHSASGLEDETGTYGITYPKDSLADGRVIRMGYKKTLDHDMAACEIIAPASLVEANTGVDPITVIGNYGNSADSCEAILDIYNSKDSLVYHNVITLPDGIDFGLDTLGPSKWPIWTPEKPGEHFRVVLTVKITEDQSPDNDTLTKIVWTDVSGMNETITPPGFALKFDDIGIIRFSMPYTARVELVIYDVNGNRVQVLTNKTYQAGAHTLHWDRCDSKGQRIPGGVYFVQIKTADWRMTRKVIVY